jgi:hypothetical protein
MGSKMVESPELRRFPLVEEWSTDRGLVRLERPVAGVVLTKVEGFAAVELGARLIAWVNASIEQGERPTVLHDWEGATGYEPALRPRFTEWYLRVRKEAGEVHVLTRSKLVTMGVTLVSLATGNEIFAYTDRHAFSRAFEQALLDATTVARRRSAAGP